MPWRLEEVSEVPRALRSAHLDALGEAQELFVERLVASGRTYLLYADRGPAPAGYAVVHEGAVVELSVDGEPSRIAGALGHVPADRALVQTFDVRLLEAARARSARSSMVGHLFRRYDARAFDSELSARVAVREDVGAVLSMHDGFFDDAAEIEAYVDVGGLILFTSASGELVACGVFRRVVAGRDAVDVGMVVAPSHRGAGFGTRAVAHVANRCVATGLSPIAGCGVDNPASRAALLRAGFVETHALVEVRW